MRFKQVRSLAVQDQVSYYHVPGGFAVGAERDARDIDASLYNSQRLAQ